jgi:hypothetical protein
VAALRVAVAQTADPAAGSASASASASESAAPAPGPAAASNAPRTSPEQRAIPFTPENIALAFKFLDRDKNGSISREEAAAVRGVARNFDRADINQDGVLSRQEFDNAMNRAKSR